MNGLGPRKIVIALDQGSSSSRALAFDSAGGIVARSQHAVKTLFPRPGWVEHDPLDLAGTLESALDEILEKIPAGDEIVGAGMASQRSTVVLWDAESGRPIGNAPSWQDARAAASVAALQADRARQERVHEKTGIYLTPFYSAPKIRFLLDNDPAVAGAAAKGTLRAGPVSCWIVWRLTGGRVFRTDASMAQRMMLYNLKDGDWDAELLEMFGLNRSMLPEIAPTTGSYGRVERKGRSFEIRAVLGDQQSAALGQGGGSAGRGVLNYGTGAFFLLHTGEELHRIPGLLTSAAWTRRGRATEYFMEGTVHAAGTSFEWLKKGLGLLKDVRDADAAYAASKSPILALQALGGLGAPRWDFQTPTVFYGITPGTVPADIVRGMIESIGYWIADIVDPIREAGLEIADIRASGGLANLESLLQFQAGILGSRIARLKESEATALGAASLAAEAAGEPWAGELRRGETDRVFEPGLEPAAAAAMKRRWRLFVETQRKLAAELKSLGAA